jgi:hypothetical protein
MYKATAKSKTNKAIKSLKEDSVSKITGQNLFFKTCVDNGAKCAQGKTSNGKELYVQTIKDVPSYEKLCSTLDHKPSILVLDEWTLKGFLIDPETDKTHIIYITCNYERLFDEMAKQGMSDLVLIDPKGSGLGLCARKNVGKISKKSEYIVEYEEDTHQIIVDAILGKRNFLKEIKTKCYLLYEGERYQVDGKFISSFDFELGSNKVVIKVSDYILTATLTNDDGTLVQTYTLRSGKLKKQIATL